jgi:hypothetical protein
MNLDTLVQIGVRFNTTILEGVMNDDRRKVLFIKIGVRCDVII